MNIPVFVVFAILLVLLVYTWRRYQMIKAKLHSTEVMQSVPSEADLILQNINAYFLLVNKDYIVCNTNYYSLNNLPTPMAEEKRVGELLHCRNAIDAGECGGHEQCKLCCIRIAIGKAFRAKANINRLEASMNLLSEDGHNVTPCDVSVSGTYINVQEEDYMLLTIYDVTELMNMQKLLTVEKENSASAERLRATFIQNMSHEVRTPLNAIVGFSGLIATATCDEERKAYVDIVVENNERLLRLVNDIFDLSQIETGSLDFNYSEFDANDLLREVESLFKIRLGGSAEVKLVCEAEAQPIMMYSEHKRIVQVMINLLHNAMKFTEKGEIRLGCCMEDEASIRFWVSDTGIGISEKEQEKIFLHFAKLNREVPGTGLGLTLSQTIIQNLGGRLGLESAVNEGSTFGFVVPLRAK